MNVIRPDKTDGTEVELDTDLAAVSEVEAGIRDFVRNDIAYLRRPNAAATAEAAIDADAAVNSVTTLIQRVAGTSLSEIENLIGELESLRELLHTEGQRVQREIASYAQLSQVAMTSVKIISESMGQWKSKVQDVRLDRP